MNIELRAIGHVESPLTDPAQAPRQPDEGAPAATLVFAPSVVAALDGLNVGDAIVLITWFDRAARDALVVHPRGDRTRPPMGVLATRSPDRPNPIGLHTTTITEINGARVGVDHLEALDGTPILDVKPVLGPVDQR
ncbi:tRNA (N6-threonylcarbamoyladenosine(37)-N6)-methyltransferase TrmO [Labedaea rhizosphaerae]|uniref:tRNA-Thr(GGU) m(6)t(6)A37 methyltransferase TsaA n=1 Tax=Labedaea rhizosphaerae TaxID=598644 RepID=A0A4R6RV30_LABRH|nr:tRNA (N6-threonylcarbamoyladenosine(37)-N6)-methyltransferase TrmO [Labedaea rhizosphaerae]TDP89946.1 tRNA-Thr(GGU) m(6)t(6)A37 methyltransferase TsaA [Labedaea rhizosphaerae]